jgi:hypothetical protein
VKLPTSERFPTCGPRSRFGAILFIEKEGFLPLFDRVKLAERYDLAIMSTKGMSVTASRLLIDELCGNGNSIPLFVLHDFDKAGFSILGTLQRDTRRYEFKNHVHVVDLGLRLEDIERYSLESERVHYGKSDPSWNLRDNGATEKEIAFLCEEDHRWGSSRGRRVELNAFASGDLIEWIEGKLKEHRVKKVLPERECLEAAYRRSLGIEELRREVKRTEKAIARKVKDAKVPRGLERAIKLRLRDEPELSWDAALAEEVRQRLKSNGNGHAGGEG